MALERTTIEGIFLSGRIIEVPFYQRRYVWDEEQWERFLSDMVHLTATHKNYFLGAIILKQQTTRSDASYTDLRTIVDGQQRLTTILIFLKALCLKTGENEGFKRDFTLEDGELKLRHNKLDSADFQRVMSLEEPMRLAGDSEGRNIVRAYNYFYDHIDINEVNRRSVKAFAQFVTIDVAEDEDEQQIFDTINSLGVDLTTAELLKNFFFNRDNVKDYERYWEQTFERDDDTTGFWGQKVTTGRLTRALSELFFSSYLTIRTQDKSLAVSSADKKDFERIDELFSSYKLLLADYLHLREDYTSFLDDMDVYARAFKENFDPLAVSREVPSAPCTERMNVLAFGATTTIVPYCLYLLVNVNDPDDRNEMFRILESYLMRRQVTRDTTKNYNRFFDALIADKILTPGELVERILGQSDLGGAAVPSDEEVREGFHSSRLTNSQSRMIIYLLESSGRSAKHGTALLGLENYSLEHLMPKKWEQNWPLESADEDARLRRDRTLLTLGNLAIITQPLNGGISNLSWNSKKDKGLKRYGMGLGTLDPYLELATWDEGSIASRADDLANLALSTWSIGIPQDTSQIG